MSTDKKITEDLIQTLEDGKNGFAKGAEKLRDSSASAAVVSLFEEFSRQREQFSADLRLLAQQYDDKIEESGSIVGALHRGWLSLKDALSGDDPSGVLDAAEQGEDHAVSEYEKALADEGISVRLRAVVERQFADVKTAHDRVRSLRDAQS